MNRTSIEWADESWNPVRGCSRISRGCKLCYAEKIAGRFSGGRQAFEGFAIIGQSGARWTGRVELLEEKLLEPVRRRAPQNIFVNSTSDLWHEKLAWEAKVRIYAVMSIASWHTFLVLTKRPAVRLETVSLVDFEVAVREEAERLLVKMWRRKLPKAWKFVWPLPHVWEGVSIEDRDTAEERLPILRRTPAALRFVSYEPALEAVTEFGDGIDWIIFGGESGLKDQARPCDIQAALGVVEYGARTGTPVFLKQLGSEPFDGGLPGEAALLVEAFEGRRLE